MSCSWRHQGYAQCQLQIFAQLHRKAPERSRESDAAQGMLHRRFRPLAAAPVLRRFDLEAEDAEEAEESPRRFFTRGKNMLEILWPLGTGPLPGQTP